MITTITATSATSTVATASLALIAILTLLMLLIQKEIISGLDGASARHLGRALNIAIVPLIVVCITIMAFRMVDFLR